MNKAQCDTCLYNKNCQLLAKHKFANISGCTAYKNSSDVMEWISVKDRLPDKEDKYLVVLEGQITIQRFNHCDSINNTWWKKYISHWMPLPGLPKGE